MTTENKRAVSSRQELQIAKLLGWKQVRCSGSRPCTPGDIISDLWLGECKTHMISDKPIVFLRKVWNKVCEEAIGVLKYPAVFVDDGSQEISKTWVMFNKTMCEFSISQKICMYNKSFETAVRFKHADMVSYLEDEHAKICNLSGTNICITVLNNFQDLLYSA